MEKNTTYCVTTDHGDLCSEHTDADEARRAAQRVANTTLKRVWVEFDAVLQDDGRPAESFREPFTPEEEVARRARQLMRVKAADNFPDLAEHILATCERINEKVAYLNLLQEMYEAKRRGMRAPKKSDKTVARLQADASALACATFALGRDIEADKTLLQKLQACRERRELEAGQGSSCE
jgi:hypothetical protein